ncbi:MAG: DUF1048 domain-containing protein [Romboutsia sp.]|uniref:DUF1048 domain-containing protein n=1 Tax=Romboutsia sp. TaxID=1965302 RepID=UPI003F2F0208
MFDNFIKLIIGDLDEKREYKKMMNRIDSLPEDYRFAFKKIQKYIYTVGGSSGDMTIFTDMAIFMDLVDLFEASIADGRTITDVIGSDVSKFSDEFMNAYSTDSKTLREKLNKDIMERFNKEGR